MEQIIQTLNGIPPKKRSNKSKPKPSQAITDQSEEVRIELVVSGYVRRMESNQPTTIAVNAENVGLQIPRPLVELIIRFHHREWKFIYHDDYGSDIYQQNVVTISDDGLSASISEKKYASIQFGPFWSAADRMIYRFRIKMGCPPQCGVGFITQSFTAFVRHHWNNGEPGSMCLYTNGFNPVHKDMKVDGKGVSTSDILNNGGDWLHSTGDEVVVKIDTSLMKVLIWNETKLGIGDLEFEDVACHGKYVFHFQLPKEKSIGLVFEMGFREQTTTVIEQTFISLR